MKEELVVKEVEFNGANLLACQREDGKVFVVLKRFCDELGIDSNAQSQRIRRDEVLSEGACKINVPSDGGYQATMMLDLDYLSLWLTGVKINQCREEIRPYLKEFKLKAKDVLAKAFIKQTVVDQLLLEDLTIKASKFDILMNANDDTDMLKFSHILNEKGLGRNKLFAYLRSKNVLMSKSNRKNVPYEKYKKYFNVIEETSPKGHITYQTLVTPTGQNFILDMLIEDGKINVGNVGNVEN